MRMPATDRVGMYGLPGQLVARELGQPPAADRLERGGGVVVHGRSPARRRPPGRGRPRRRTRSLRRPAPTRRDGAAPRRRRRPPASARPTASASAPRPPVSPMQIRRPSSRWRASRIASSSRTTATVGACVGAACHSPQRRDRVGPHTPSAVMAVLRWKCSSASFGPGPEDAVDPAGVEARGAEVSLELGDVVAAQHRRGDIQQPVAEPVAGLDQRRPGLLPQTPSARRPRLLEGAHGALGRGAERARRVGR